MRTSWKAKRTGKKYCSSCVCLFACRAALCVDGDDDDKGHSGVLSIFGIVPFNVSIACKDFFWNREFLEKSVKQTMRSGNAPWDITTPSLVL
jgi:hypothetical protein